MLAQPAALGLRRASRCTCRRRRTSSRGTSSAGRRARCGRRPGRRRGAGNAAASAHTRFASCTEPGSRRTGGPPSPAARPASRPPAPPAASSGAAACRPACRARCASSARSARALIIASRYSDSAFIAGMSLKQNSTASPCAPWRYARPRRHAEDVLLFPLEALAADLGPAAAGGDLVDQAAGVAPGLGFLDQLQARAHGRHHRAAGERVLVLVRRRRAFTLRVALVPLVEEHGRVGLVPVVPRQRRRVSARPSGCTS